MNKNNKHIQNNIPCHPKWSHKTCLQPVSVVCKI